MDAKEFLKERKRMCDSIEGSESDSCEGCPLNDNGFYFDCDFDVCARHADQVVQLVEQWSREHPEEEEPEESVTLDEAIKVFTEMMEDALRCDDMEGADICDMTKNWLVELKDRRKKDMNSGVGEMTNSEKFVEVFGYVPGFELACLVREPREKAEQVTLVAHRKSWWDAKYRGNNYEG